jgi:hypothetical protein
MPIKEIFLYDNGYAVFRREAEVQGSGQVNLFFHRNQMNSVLESLQLFGEASSKIGNIAYEPTKPRPDVDIGDDNPYVSLLSQMKGLDVKVVTCNQEGENVGRLLGVNTQYDSASKEDVTHVILFVEPNEVRSVPLHSLQSLQVMDERMQHNLSHALDLATTSENDEIQKLSFFFSDIPSAQSLKAQYGLVTSEWKSTYRLVFLDDSHVKFRLDGMAVVENNFDEDWTNVQLSLVVGAPPLSTKKAKTTTGIWSLNIKHFLGGYFTIRCNPKDTIMSLKMKVYEVKKKPPLQNFKLRYAGKPLDPGRLVSDYTISDGSTLQMEIGSGIEEGGQQAPTSAVEFVMSSLDSLSFYPIATKVTAQRKQKAIVPMLHTTLEAHNVVLYNELIRRGNPLSAVLFANSTGRTLDGGKIQLYRQDQFLGSGDLPTLHQGDESPPIPYAVKMGCEVVKETANKYMDFHRIVIEDREIRLLRKRQVITIYRIRNKTDEELDFLLDHLFLDEYELVREDLMDEAGEPVDITDKVYQFRFTVEAKDEKKKFTVIEETESMEKTQISDLTHFHTAIRDDNAKQWVNAATYQALCETMTLRGRIRSAEAEIYAKEDEVREIQDNQSHLRSNITALEGNKAEAAKYIKSLAAEEDKLKACRQAIKRLRQDKKELSDGRDKTMGEIKYSKKLK